MNEYSYLKQFCNTQNQYNVMSILEQHGNREIASIETGLSSTAIQSIVGRVRRNAKEYERKNSSGSAYDTTTMKDEVHYDINHNHPSVPQAERDELDKNQFHFQFDDKGEPHHVDNTKSAFSPEYENQVLQSIGVDPQFQHIKGHSVYVEDGEKKREWIKTSRVFEDEKEKLLQVAESLKDSFEPASEIDYDKQNHHSSDDNLVNCFILSDAHIGMFAWDEETKDDNWDMNIAVDTIVEWFKEAICQAPNAETAILAQLGDLIHWDGLLPVTPTSGNILDADTKFQKLVRVAIKVMTNVIRMLLKTHKHVHVIMAEGNHDLASSAWLREMFSHFFSDNERVTVDISPDPYYCYEHGKTSIFFHHGHKSRINNITQVFVGKFRDTFGRTKFSYGHTGHLHHAQLKENNLMVIEQHQTLASKDSHAANHGYLAGRSASCITYHKDYGEVSRNRINADMVKDKVLQSKNGEDSQKDDLNNV
ncbi:hypothetical protein PBI_SCTP2_468 [Salicola phage SCTP-2]|nr:hypothetical protein PBI_SCTP2_468 [Salicola phage SCTP-2]